MAIVAANPTQGANLFSGTQSFYTHDDRADAKDGTNVYLHTALEFSATEAEELCDAIRYQASVLKGGVTDSNVHPIFAALDISGTATVNGVLWARGNLDGTNGHFHGSIQADGSAQAATAYFGSTSGSSSFESDGTLVFNGNATVWDDVRVPMTATTKGGSKDPGFQSYRTNGSGSQGVFAYYFDNATEEEMYFSCQLPHGYKQGTNLQPHVHFSVPGAGSAGQYPQFGLEYVISSIGNIDGSTSIIYADCTSAANATTSGDASLVAYKHYRQNLPDISGTNLTISAMMSGRVFRNAGGTDDDYGSDSILHEIDFHIEMDTVGSRTATAK